MSLNDTAEIPGIAQGTVKYGLPALGLHVNRNTLRILNAIELAAEEKAEK